MSDIDLKDIFEFTEVNDDMTGIRVVEGEYKGLHWTFGTVTFGESPDEEGNLSCHFDYVIHDNPNEIEENQQLLNFMGDILIEVLDQELEEEHIDSDDIPFPSLQMAKNLIDNKAVTDYIRENHSEDELMFDDLKND